LAINENDRPTKEAVNDMLRSGVRQMRYRLKKKYFNGVPANEIPTTSPVQCMSDEEWRSLVAKWTNPKNMVWVSCHIFYLIEFPMDLVI
jgi:hypothetical protein